MKKITKKQLTDFLIEILNELKVEHYQKIDIGDNDINFIVTPKVDKSDDKDLKLSFFLYCSDETSLSLYCPIIYKLKPNDSIMYTLNAINDVNNRIALGKIYLNKENGSVISYINRILFNNMIEDLTPQLLNEYIKAFIYYSFEFYEHMRKIINEN